MIYLDILNTSEVQAVLENGEAKKDAIRPDFNKSIFIDFAGAKITSEVSTNVAPMWGWPAPPKTDPDIKLELC